MVRFKRMSTSDLEMPLCSQNSTLDASRTVSGASFLRLQLAACSILLLGGIIIYASGSFTWCAEVSECHNMDSLVSSSYHIVGVFVLTPLLLSELINLLSSYHEAHEPHVAILLSPSRWQASLLMCVVFSMLLITETSFATGHGLVHAVAQKGMMETSRPVYTMRYMEWLVNVPILLTISGHFCLGRPMSELVGPIFATDVYIFLSWEAFVVHSQYLSWTLVVISFALYAWASYEMLMWATSFLRLPRGNFPARRLRAAMIVGIVIVFGVYGVIYLLAIVGVIGAAAEQACYTIGDVGVKTALWIMLRTIRDMDSRHVLAVSFRQITSQSDTLISLLRGSFDIVMKCSLDPHGNCWLPSSDSTDLKKLEHWLNRSAVGCALNELIDGPEQQKRFHSYVLGALQRTGINSVSEQGVAQVINCALSSISGHGAVSRQTAVLHISGVSSLSTAGMERTAFIAMCISPGDEEVPFIEVQGGIKKDDCLARPVDQSVGSLALSDTELFDQVSESSQSRSEVNFYFSERTVKSRSSLPKVLENHLDASSTKTSLGHTELIDSFAQTDEKVCISVAAQTEHSATLFPGTRPPICPGRPASSPRTVPHSQNEFDGNWRSLGTACMGHRGDDQGTESSQDRAGTAGTAPLDEEPSEQEKLARWRARKDKKKAEREKKKTSRSYGAMIRNEKMDIQAGRTSTDYFSGCSSQGSYQSGFSSRGSYQSGSEMALSPEPAHVINHRSPRDSEWHLHVGNCEQQHRSWMVPKVELPESV